MFLYDEVALAITPELLAPKVAIQGYILFFAVELPSPLCPLSALVNTGFDGVPLSPVELCVDRQPKAWRRTTLNTVLSTPKTGVKMTAMITPAKCLNLLGSLPRWVSVCE